MLLGELGGYDSGSPHRIGISEFVRSMPADVLCLSDTWAVHAYAARGSRSVEENPVQALETALDARGGCGASAKIWVTEAGAGAPDPGRAVRDTRGEEHAACVALARQVGDWYSDPRVGAVFQYTFRDDPAFPVGLADPRLTRVLPTYGVWLALSARHSASEPLPAPDLSCGASAPASAGQ